MPERQDIVRKRSVTIDGHRTSISLEAPFWEELASLATQRGLSVQALIAQIDHARGPSNLSSALRVHVLRSLRDQVEAATPHP